MKKIIFILFLLPTLLYSQSNEKYKEFNFGVILIDVFENSNSNDGLFSDDFQLYPGASFLLGKTHYFNNNTLLDYQAGFAFPTVVTGKIGFGIGNSDFATVVGVRPWPPTAYLQLSINQKTNFSIEYVEPEMWGEALIINYGIRF